MDTRGLGRSRNRSKAFDSLRGAGVGLLDRTRWDGFKLKEGRFRLDIRKEFLMVKVVKCRHRLPREVGDASSLETFKVRLDWVLSNLTWLKMSLPIAGRLD